MESVYTVHLRNPQAKGDLQRIEFKSLIMSSKSKILSTCEGVPNDWLQY